MKVAFFFLYLIQLLPFAAIQKLADAIGSLAYYAVVPRRRIGETNLRLCFPELSEKQRKTLLKRHFRHMAKLILEYGLYWYGSAERLKSLVRYQDKHHLDNELAAGNKVILLYPHFTAFELAVYALNQDVPLTSMYSHQKNPVLDQQILRGRHRYNNVFLIGRTEGLRRHHRRPAPHRRPHPSQSRARHPHPPAKRPCYPALLPRLGQLPQRRRTSRRTAHERLHRRARARTA